MRLVRHGAGFQRVLLLALQHFKVFNPEIQTSPATNHNHAVNGIAEVHIPGFRAETVLVNFPVIHVFDNRPHQRHQVR